MKLSLKCKIKNIDSKNKEIIKDLQWHVKKVSNMLLYENSNRRDKRSKARNEL